MRVPQGKQRTQTHEIQIHSGLSHSSTWASAAVPAAGVGDCCHSFSSLLATELVKALGWIHLWCQISTFISLVSVIQQQWCCHWNDSCQHTVSLHWRFCWSVCCERNILLRASLGLLLPSWSSFGASPGCFTPSFTQERNLKVSQRVSKSARVRLVFPSPQHAWW